MRATAALSRCLGLLLVAGASATWPAVGQPPPANVDDGFPTGWTSELHMEHRTVQGTAVSPDGSLVAFVVREPLMHGERSEYRSQVWSFPGRPMAPRSPSS